MVLFSSAMYVPASRENLPRDHLACRPSRIQCPQVTAMMTAGSILVNKGRTVAKPLQLQLTQGALQICILENSTEESTARFGL